MLDKCYTIHLKEECVQVVCDKKAIYVMGECDDKVYLVLRMKLCVMCFLMLN